ncbi:cytochrome c family protein [Methylocapsa sp. D3K7]|uniref:c-type cytochrome n=1 Tax=Methylocapsa sp. D3K7 TaxID=3041435 RepID=UPI00244EAAA6|nr:cytochrome c family protein [Methylocapsa sp. D3K7]WGJ13980.1 cytochrome c family protein [Methylocapsa sp. D3K7]
MDSFELNKIAGAFLGTLLFAMWLSVISGGIFSHDKPAKPGYPLPAAQEVVEAGGGAAAPSIPPIGTRLSLADVKKGEVDTKPCQSCHNLEKGGGVKIGPPLFGIVTRPKGTVAGFEYSEAIKSKGGTWTYEELDAFLANPKAYAQGTKMAYAGEADPAKRADLIDYLHTLSDSPEPLPAAGSAPPPADSAAAPSPKLESPPPAKNEALPPAKIEAPPAKSSKGALAKAALKQAK